MTTSMNLKGQVTVPKHIRDSRTQDLMALLRGEASC